MRSNEFIATTSPRYKWINGFSVACENFLVYSFHRRLSKCCKTIASNIDAHELLTKQFDDKTEFFTSLPHQSEHSCTEKGYSCNFIEYVKFTKRHASGEPDLFTASAEILQVFVLVSTRHRRTTTKQRNYLGNVLKST